MKSPPNSLETQPKSNSASCPVKLKLKAAVAVVYMHT